MDQYQSTRLFRWVAVLLLIVFVPAVTYTPAYAQFPRRAKTEKTKKTDDRKELEDMSEEEELECFRGSQQGKVDAEGNPVWIFAGVGCGLIGFMAAAFTNPAPPAEAFAGKSSEYMMCYTEEYRKGSKSKNMRNACVGWVVGVAITLPIVLSME